MATLAKQGNFTIFEAKLSTFVLEDDVNIEGHPLMIAGLWIILQSPNSPWSEACPQSTKSSTGHASNETSVKMLKSMDENFFEGRMLISFPIKDSAKAPLNLNPNIHLGKLL